MMTRRSLLGSFSGAAAAFLAGCGDSQPRNYRFKMTLNVNTPGGAVAGSSIYEVTAFQSTDLITGVSGWGPKLRGEAVALDLPGDKTLFALLKTVNDLHDDLVTASLVTLDPAFGFNFEESAARVSNSDTAGIRAPVPPDYYPMLVTFNDIRDPASLIAVDADDLSADFGDGFDLTTITMETVSDAKTVGVQSRLPWLKSIGRQRGTLIPNPPRLLKDSTPIQRVTPADFSTEIDWKT